MSLDVCKLVGRDKRHLVQLCLPYEKLKGTLKFPVLASEKLDGVFAFAVCNRFCCTIFSRTGEEYVSLNHLKEPLLALSNELQCEVIIFEAYAEGVPQPTISGWCRDTKKQHLEVEAYIHDAMTLDEFAGNRLAETYYVRAEYLRLHMTQNPYLHLIEQRHVTNELWLNPFGQQVVKVLWHVQSSLVTTPGKRNQYMVKLKKGVSFDLKVVGVEEGTGKYKGSTGKLVCQDRKGKTIKVGSGLTDEQRATWWSPYGYDEIVGKVVQIDAMAVSTKGVLREPRFKGIRYDKKEVDAIV